MPGSDASSHRNSLEIKKLAYEMGFDLAGVTTPDPPEHLDVYQNWIANGLHAGMAYLASERAIQRRNNPRLILEGCRSILVLGKRYFLETSNDASSDQALIAGYAIGQDYHDVLIERMQRLMEQIQSTLGIQIAHRIYTDTGPLLEREFAQRAGLGWIGKNTCLIHPQLGSALLLGEILLDLDLAPDPPFLADRCGTCQRCIEACPTQCIRPDRTIDANRCIAFLTIENKGEIPVGIRPQIGAWTFGCDVCQQVCPWNQRFNQPCHDPAFQARPFLDPPHLQTFLKLQEAEYKAKLQGSPLKRSKRHGLLRNAAVAAGNNRDPRLIPLLRRLLESDDEPLVRAHAAWALGHCHHPEAHAALVDARMREADSKVRGEISRALFESAKPPRKTRGG